MRKTVLTVYGGPSVLSAVAPHHGPLTPLSSRSRESTTP
jgi:hypothetical protein